MDGRTEFGDSSRVPAGIEEPENSELTDEEVIELIRQMGFDVVGSVEIATSIIRRACCRTHTDRRIEWQGRGSKLLQILFEGRRG